MALKGERVTARIGTLHCAKCHKLIKKGSKAVAVKAKVGFLYYHLGCYKGK